MKHKIYIAMMAVAALAFAACDKPAEGYDSFILDIAGFNGADGSKAYWDASGFWWENNTDPDGGDAVLINGDVHNIYRDGSQWKTHAEAPTNPIDGNYYIAYAGNGDNTRGMVWNSDSKLYGPVTFDGSIVPLAICGNSNRMTLWPCCAVIRTPAGGLWSPIVFMDDESNPGTVSGRILSSGYINPATSSLVFDEEMDYSEGIRVPISGNDGVYDYYVIPMEGNSVTAFLTINDEPTSHEVTIRKGVLYTYGD